MKGNPVFSVKSHRKMENIAVIVHDHRQKCKILWDFVYSNVFEVAETRLNGIFSKVVWTQKSSEQVTATRYITASYARCLVSFSTVLTGAVGTHQPIFFDGRVGARGVISEMRRMNTLGANDASRMRKQCPFVAVTTIFFELVIHRLQLGFQHVDLHKMEHNKAAHTHKQHLFEVL